MFGKELLVAPVMEANEMSRSVYLPQGCTWTDVWSYKEYAGGQTVTVDCPIDTIPVFTKSESCLNYFR